MRIEVEGGAAELLVPIAAAGDVDGRQLRLPLAGEVENQFVLAPRAVRLASFSLARNERTLAAEPIIWSAVARSAQLRKPSTVGDLLPRGQQIEQYLLVGRVGAGVLGQKHALAQRGVAANVITGCMSG